MMKFLMAIAAMGLCFAPKHASGQSPVILKGRVRDMFSGGIPGARIAFLSLPDSASLKVAFTDSTGRYVLSGVPNVAGVIRCTAPGFQTHISAAPLVPGDVTDNMKDIVLLPEPSTGLKEVVVSGKTPLVVRKQDRVVVHVDALISAGGTTALDVLRKSPGVLVDQNGNISLRGKQGVNVYIDDKPTYLSGDELADYLRSLPAATLADIELMTNPPARYDAAGTAGIINIRTKKTASRGFHGSLNPALTQGQLTRSNNSLNLNFRNRKLRVVTNLGYNLNNSFTDLKLNRTYLSKDNTPDAYFEQASYFRRHGSVGSIRTAVDYYYSENTTFGMMLSGMRRSSENVNDNASTLLNAGREADSIIVARNSDQARFDNRSANLNYRRTFSRKGEELTADADYIGYRSRAQQQFYNTASRPDGSFPTLDTLTGQLPTFIDIYALKADYTTPLSASWKMESGIKWSLTNTDNTAAYATRNAGVDVADYTKSNHFLYRETISAGYLNFSRETDRFSIQGGLRAEHTTSAGHQLGNPLKPDSAFNREYSSLFPTFYVSYKLDSAARHQLGLNYGRRIERPYYQDLNPFINPMDKFTYYTGNPFLRPSFVQSVELTHTYRNMITTSLSYSRSRDDVNETIEIRNGIYYSRPGNIGRKSIASISVDGSFDPFKWLNIHLYSEFTNIAARSEFYSGLLNTSGNVWVGSANVRMTLGHGWDAEIGGNYRTPIVDAQFVLGSMGTANLGVQKKVSSKITARLSVNDLFYSELARGKIGNLTRADASWTNRGDSRNVVVSFSYRFGTAFTNDRQHEASGADTEKQRVKN